MIICSLFIYIFLLATEEVASYHRTSFDDDADVENDDDPIA